MNYTREMDTALSFATHGHADVPEADARFWAEVLDALGLRFYHAAIRHDGHGLRIGASNEDELWRFIRFPLGARPRVDDIAIRLNAASGLAPESAGWWLSHTPPKEWARL